MEGGPSQPGLLTLLPDLAADPQVQLMTQSHWVNRNQIRRPNLAALAQAFYRAHDVDPQGQPKQYLDNRVESSVDGYENRLLKLFLRQVSHHCRRLLPALEAKSPPNYTEARQLQQRLHQVQQIHSAFLQAIQPLDYAPHNLTMALLHRPAYRALLERYLEFHRSMAVDIQDPLLETPLENLPKLYQYWCVLQIAQVLLEVSTAYGYHLQYQRLVQRDRTGCHLIIPQGKAMISLDHANGTHIELIPERTYGQSGPLQSSTGNHRPDAALERQDADGQYRIYLFDPKYKLDSEQGTESTHLGTPKKADIDKMHVYRDAIRNAQGHHVVEYAAILYPGQSYNYAQAGIAAISAHPDHLEALHQSIQQIMETALNPESTSNFLPG
jgi:predicted component of viral defense system (DUF524 family)